MNTSKKMLLTGLFAASALLASGQEVSKTTWGVTTGVNTGKTMDGDASVSANASLNFNRNLENGNFVSGSIGGYGARATDAKVSLGGVNAALAFGNEKLSGGISGGYELATDEGKSSIYYLDFMGQANIPSNFANITAKAHVGVAGGETELNNGLLNFFYYTNNSKWLKPGASINFGNIAGSGLDIGAGVEAYHRIGEPNENRIAGSLNAGYKIPNSPLGVTGEYKVFDGGSGVDLRGTLHKISDEFAINHEARLGANFDAKNIAFDANVGFVANRNGAKPVGGAGITIKGKKLNARFGFNYYPKNFSRTY
ncbi:MAG: hypothetical protein LBM01_03465 [Christensenellaceae bacterium]|jgi:hypothetical protein|nr:hypothetical protein [Christensenellaceae bacterium]